MVDLDIRSVFHESFLGALPESVRSDLAASVRILHLPTGKLIYDPQLSIVADGTLRAFVEDGTGRHLTLSYLDGPRAIGVASAAGRENPVAFQAVTASTILRLSQARFDEILQTHTEVGWAAAKELACNLDAVLAEFARVAFQPLRAHIAHHLLALAERGEDNTQSVHQAELAAAVGSDREVVDRTVGTLSEFCLVEVCQTGIAAINEEGLRQMADQRE
jgi:CRP-like cAMP-binding protein